MEAVFETSRALSILAFLSYGLACLFGQSMVAEFERFGLVRFRALTGALEVLGALGLIASYAFPSLLIASAGGLSVVMVLGIAARARIRDPLTSMLPAFALLVINAFVCAYAIQRFPQP